MNDDGKKSRVIPMRKRMTEEEFNRQYAEHRRLYGKSRREARFLRDKAIYQLAQDFGLTMEEVEAQLKKDQSS